MSMLSEQIKELWKKADELDEHGAFIGFGGSVNRDPLMHDAAVLMRDAADTIESLRDRLHATIETCELKGRSDICSKCGASVERVTHSIFEMGDGFACRPNFCPNCGAKVKHD